MIEKWKKRAQALSKQCTDLSTVMKRYITESKNKPRERVTPVRITRSVGLQVMSPEQRRLHQQKQQQQRGSPARPLALSPARIQSNGVPRLPTRQVRVRYNFEVQTIKQYNINFFSKIYASHVLPSTTGWRHHN